MLPNDPELFCRGDVLVRIVRETEENAKLDGGVEVRNATGAARVSLIGEAGLSCRLSAIADLYSWKEVKGESVSRPAHPPTWLVAATLENAHYPGVRRLRGIAEVPFPRPDGTLVTEPGYDPATGVFHSPTIQIPHIPSNPTQDDARKAAGRLLGYVGQFPWASTNDAAVWLAGLLTVIARPAIQGPVPGFAFVANKAGTGKGLLIDAIGIAATGRGVPCTSYPKDDSEAAKVVTAHALASTQVIHLDNLNEGQAYGSGPLDSALTATEVNNRILGLSKNTGPIELRACWFLSGNNLTPAKDAYRRWLVINLQTNMERPEERADLTFPNLRQHLKENRASIVHDALVILRAHAHAGRPANGWAPLGSYEDWDGIVRGSVWFATGLDCNATRRQAAEDSPERQDKLRLLLAWQAMPGGDKAGMTAVQAFKFSSDPSGNSTRESLADALMQFSRDGKVPSPRIIGNTVRSMSGQNFGGYAFRKKGDANQGALWAVVEVFPNTPNQPKSGLISQTAIDSVDSVDSVPHSPACEVYPDNYVNTYGSNGSAHRDGCPQESIESTESIRGYDPDDWTTQP